MALLATTVSVSLRISCLERVGFESVQVVKRPQPGDPVVVVKVRLYCAQSCSDTPQMMI